MRSPTIRCSTRCRSSFRARSPCPPGRARGSTSSATACGRRGGTRGPRRPRAPAWRASGGPRERRPMTAPDASPQSDDDPERPTLEKRVQDALWTAGCLFVLGMILLLGALGLRVLGPWWLLALCIGLIVGTIYGVIAVHRIRNRRAVRGFHRAFGTLGKDLLLVTSDSPHWKDYIERHWLPRWGSRAVVINWSERSRWEETRPEIALFRRFKGGLE